MESLRYKTSKSALSKQHAWFNPHRFKNVPNGFHKIQVRLKKARDTREAQQAESGLCEFPHELVNKSDGKVIKKAYMKDSDRQERNPTISDLGMFWRRVGY